MKGLKQIRSTTGSGMNWGLYQRGKAQVFISEPFNPYRQEKGKRRVNPLIRRLRGEPAVYVIETTDGKPVYVGASLGSAYKTILRHFQMWNDTNFVRKYYSPERYRVRIVMFEGMDTQIGVWGIERVLIQLLEPRDNRAGMYAPFNHKSQAVDRAVTEEIEAMAAFLMDEEPELMETPVGDYRQN